MTDSYNQKPDDEDKSSKPVDDSPSTKKESIKLPQESGEELVGKQSVIPSPCWEPFVKKSNEDEANGV